MEPPFEVSYPQYIEGDDVREFTSTAGLYSFPYQSESYLDRDNVRYDAVPVPSPMLASMASGPAEKLSHHVEEYSGRENDVYVRDIDLTIERQVTAPISLTFSAELEETMLKLSNYASDNWMKSIYTPVDVDVTKTVDGQTIATGQLTLFIDYLEDWQKD